MSIPAKAAMALGPVHLAPIAFAELLAPTAGEAVADEGVLCASVDDLEAVDAVDLGEVDPVLNPAGNPVVPTCAFEVELGTELWAALGTAGLVPETTGFVRAAGVGSESVAEREWNDDDAAAELDS
jgi:hypothetical protein